MKTESGIIISDHALFTACREHNDNLVNSLSKIASLPAETVNRIYKESTTPKATSYTLYAWTHKHEKNGKTVVLIAVNGKIEKKEWKKLADTLKYRYNAYYSKFMKAFVIYPDDVKAARQSGIKLHRKAPTWYRGNQA